MVTGKNNQYKYISLKNFSILIYIAINCLFIAKYSIRYSVSQILTSVIYTIFIAWFIQTIISQKKIRVSLLKIKIVYWSIVAIMISLIVALHILIDPYSIQVDRWSAIHNFISNLLNGTYPYSARTHLGGYGSPFPIWQLFHIPFYLTGEVSNAIIFVVLALAFTLIYILKSYEKSLIFILLIFVSPAFWYEVTVRSDLFYNFLICLLICAYLFVNHISIKEFPVKLGILCGLILSTRFSIVIPFAIIMGADFLASPFKNKINFILSVVFTFCITFIPFLIWDLNDLLFFKYNPFVLQTRQGSIIEVLILISLIAVFTTRLKQSLSKGFIFTSITIIIFVGATFLHRMINDNFENNIFSSSYDITYFNMALPFLIYYLSEQRENSF